jgi:hypothetical protein
MNLPAIARGSARAAASSGLPGCADIRTGAPLVGDRIGVARRLDDRAIDAERLMTPPWLPSTITHRRRCCHAATAGDESFANIRATLCHCWLAAYG